MTKQIIKDSLRQLPLQKITEHDVKEAEEVFSQPPAYGEFTMKRVKAMKVMEIKKCRGEDLGAEIQVLAVGPVAFVGVPGEFFVQLGFDIQKQSPFPHTFIVELANDDDGYLPTRRAFGEGHYEPTQAMIAPGGGEKIVEKAVEQLKQLR